MTKFFVAVLSFLALSFSGEAQINDPTFKIFQMGGFESEVFTTNNFTAIGIGKANRIWAGTQYNGLYTLDSASTIWLKSDKLTNVAINDIKMDADSGIWIGQSGTRSSGGNTAIAGGVNYFSVASDISMRFFSVLGTQTLSDLQSRNVRSLYVDQSGTAANGSLPRVWVAQGSYITSFSTRRGGVSLGLNQFTPYFAKISEGFSSQTSQTPICEAAGGNSQEVWIGSRSNQGRSSILRYAPSGSFLGYINDTSTSLLPFGFSVRAIHFDKAGNRWLGLNISGLVIKMPNQWVAIRDSLAFPNGTFVNSNAITEDEYGNVYFGTNNGLLVYKSKDYNPSSSPDNPASYQLLTTADGLPDNNINGLAYDGTYKRLLMATSNGVCFLNLKEPFIKGVVFDVEAKIDSMNATTGLQKKALPFSATVNLWDGNDLVETETVPASGVFELKKALNDREYTVEVLYRGEKGFMRNIYEKVPNKTRLKPTLVPEGLMKELVNLRPGMAEQCFSISLPFGTSLPTPCRDGFFMTDYEVANTPFFLLNGIKKDHEKQVDNLANYYVSMATVAKMGKQSMELNTEAYAAAIEAVQYLVEQAKGQKSFKDYIPEGGSNPRIPTGLEEEELKLAVNGLKLTREAFLMAFKRYSSTLSGNSDAKKMVDKCITGFSDATDIAINLLENGASKGAFELVFAQLKKLIAIQLALNDYTDEYCRDVHKDFIPVTSNGSKNKVSVLNFEQVFDATYNPNTNSLVVKGQQILTDRKSNIENLLTLANVAGSVGELSEAATALGLIPGGQLAAVFFKNLSFAAKFAKVGALGGAIYNGAIGYSEIVEESKKIKMAAGFEAITPGMAASFGQNKLAFITLDAPAALLAAKTSYFNSLNDLNAQYQQPTFNPAMYGAKYRALINQDSIYSEELRKALNGFWPYAQNANSTIAGFEAKTEELVDSFLFKQFQFRNSFYYLNRAYLYDSDKSSYVAGLDSLVQEIKVLNDSVVNKIGRLFDEINANSIPGDASMAKDKYVYNHTHQAGSSGNVQYTFRNYGSLPSQNVRVKISPLTSGYTLNSPDSIFLGTVPAGGVVNFGFSFTSPSHDSLGRYTIEVMADNGNTENVSGSLFVIDPNKYYTVKAGNWNDPTVWSSNLVPGANNPVYVGHEIMINVNATCKSLEAGPEGNVQLKPNLKLTILQ